MLAVDICDRAVVQDAYLDLGRVVRGSRRPNGEHLEVAEALRADHQPQAGVQRQRHAMGPLVHHLLNPRLVPLRTKHTTLLGVLDAELQLPKAPLSLRLLGVALLLNPLRQQPLHLAVVASHRVPEHVDLLLHAERTAAALHGREETVRKLVPHVLLCELPLCQEGIPGLPPHGALQRRTLRCASAGLRPPVKVVEHPLLRLLRHLTKVRDEAASLRRRGPGGAHGLEGRGPRGEGGFAAPRLLAEVLVLGPRVEVEFPHLRRGHLGRQPRATECRERAEAAGGQQGSAGRRARSSPRPHPCCSTSPLRL
mmetsp:Transcript_73401/g.192464  ORF Transcript_73401/g.192464 Transcript_73401/m.192464 type:complete len:310 (+) Transcript_73401:206-1135(+)